MASVIVCPECDKQLKVPDEVLGKKIRCKDCGNTFTAKAPAKASRPAGRPAGGPGPENPAAKKPGGAPANKPVTPPRPVDDDEDDEDGSKPYDVTTINLAPRCPYCANEMESEEAIICLHCGYNTVTRERAGTRKVHDTTGGDYFLWLLPGIACVLAIIAMIVGDIVYCVNIADWTGDSEWYSIFSHLAIKLWLVIISLFAMYHAGKFAIKRLILHPHPPEIERH
jgi:predicted Zn finger-like uncharacterized protein